MRLTAMRATCYGVDHYSKLIDIFQPLIHPTASFGNSCLVQTGRNSPKLIDVKAIFRPVRQM